MVLKASGKRPVVNPCFIIAKSGEGDVSLEVNGEPVPRGKDFRFGRPHMIRTCDLVTWMRIESTSQVAITLTMASDSKGTGSHNKRRVP